MIGEGATSARASLEERLRDTSAPVRVAAAEALLRAGSVEPARSILQGMAVNHDNARVRLQAIGAIDRLGDLARSPTPPTTPTSTCVGSLDTHSAARPIREAEPILPCGGNEPLRCWM